MQLMRMIFFLLLVSFQLSAIADGASGTYHMKGIAYAPDKTVLKNTELSVKIGEKTTTIMTDENGNYDIPVFWATACPTGLSAAQRKRETDRINPDHIFVKFGKKEIKIKNDWEKYTYFASTEKEPVKKMDLEFVDL